NAAKRHGVDPDLHDTPLDRALMEYLHGHLIFRNAIGNQFFDSGGIFLHALRHVPDNFVERGSNAAELLRQIQYFSELPVPAYELHLLIEDSDALSDMVESRLQQVAIILHSLRGFIE